MERFRDKVIIAIALACILMAVDFKNLIEKIRPVLGSDFDLVRSVELTGFTKFGNLITASLLNDSVVIFTSIAEHGIFKLNLNTEHIEKIGNQNKIDYITPCNIFLTDSTILFSDITNMEIKSISMSNGAVTNIKTLSYPPDQFFMIGHQLYTLNIAGPGEFILYKDSTGYVKRDVCWKNGTNPAFFISGASFFNGKIYFMLPLFFDVYEFDIQTLQSVVHKVQLPGSENIATELKSKELSSKQLSSLIKEHEDETISKFGLFDYCGKIFFIIQIKNRLYFFDPASQSYKEYYLGDYTYCGNFYDKFLFKNDKNSELRIYSLQHMSM